MIDKEKLKRIDAMLEDESKLNEYIKGIENESVKIPDNLSKNIIAKIKEVDDSNERKKIYTPKYITFNILKIAACTVFAIVIWQSQFSDEFTYEQMVSSKRNSHEVYNKINDTMKSINQFFMTPIDFKEDKK